MGGDPTTWFISGCSTGFGRSLTQAVLQAGHQVVATARDRDSIADLVARAPDRAIALELDVTNPAQIMAAVAQAEARFGRIDILVNNAGYAYQSSVEEGEEARIRAMFDANVFGLFALTRAILPIMRRQRRGHIISISSVAGLLGLAGSGYYAATKHAVEGWSDALLAEVAPLGIQVSCVEPGPFRTDFASRSLERTDCGIDDYVQTVARRMQAAGGADDDRPGDPDRAARAIIAVALAPDAPRHLVLGGMGHAMVMKRLAERIDEIGGLGEVARSADFPRP
ncbi:oxidoreductase [Rhizorhabdus dicambivorans]|uniref:Short-chain dehydrogenase/reductase n=1 Tax=Rhizorhabdus dicambivorans TaxID=1850238 RepID=A0A2A4FQ05_9SPHN|nr:oxidoreductase [Rhizorhabdus dicambivorans]ATE64676.1 short-chain dehydrogenase/reductase [Rhizorhabdus dicambivorans]PCE39790.1 short-chain dehydrogenase/reductase [Rhizorhabdus dicambivorans]